MTFHLSPNLDNNKIFLVQSRNLEERLDPFFYIPTLVALNNLIKSKTNYRLLDFSLYRASGATPKKIIDDYYSNSINGIPFIRVQNLSITGEINLNDLVYISKDVHNGMLKRSKIREHDLLVKITGVGRMAIASVVPEGFEGNINQHIVVIRTGSKEISENIAAFLNLDSVEKISTKRSTGGTRPALDYPALFSIPIINNRKIYSKIRDAVIRKNNKEEQARQLLNSIDDYLINVLGYDFPSENDNTIQNRMFTRQLSEVSGGRLDPNYHKKIVAFNDSKDINKFVKLKDLITYSPQYGANESAIDGDKNSDIRYIRITDINEIGELKNDSWKTAEIIEERYLLEFNDLLFARSGSVGRAYLHKDINEKSIFAGYLIRFVIDKAKAHPDYIFYYCHSSIYKLWVDAIYRPAVQANINAEEYKSLPIFLPPYNMQIEIAEHIADIRDRAKLLKQQAINKFELAKKDVEKMIFGDLI